MREEHKFVLHFRTYLCIYGFLVYFISTLKKRSGSDPIVFYRKFTQKFKKSPIKLLKYLFNVYLKVLKVYEKKNHLASF